MEMSLQYIKSQKGKDQLLYKGYLHTKERLIGDKTLWKCADYHKYHYCTGRAHTRKDQVIKYTPHLHPPSKRAVEAKNVACGPKKMGSSSQELTRKVVVASWNVLPHAVADKKPRIQNMEQTIPRLKACLNAARHVTCDLQTSATIAETGSKDPPLLPSLMPPDFYECPGGFENRSFTAPPVISNKTIASHSTTIQASQEAGRQRFRLGTILPGEAPQEILSRLSEAAQQWLCPCEHDKEQIVDMVILEQFLNVLPAEIQTWVRAREPGSSKEVAQLAETYLREQRVVKTTQDRVTFEDVSVHFTAEEWPLLDHEEKKNYWNVMHQNYENVAWLAGDGTDSRDPWQVAPEPVVKLPEKSKEEISQSPEQDSVGKNCLERQQQNSSGEKEEKFVLSQNVLRKVVRDRDNEPALEARCICADCENRDKSPMLLTSPRCPDKEDPEPAALSGELHERFEKKGSQNSEQNLSKEDSSSAQKQRPNHSGNEKNKSILFRNVLKDPVHQDGGPGQEVQCVCTDSGDQGELLTLVNNRKLPSGTDSECVVLAEGLLQNSEGISQSPEQDLEPNPMHSEVRPIEVTTFMGETQNDLASQQADHSGKQEGQDKSITLENGLGEEPVGDALHLGAQPGPGTQNTYVNCGGQEESSKCLSVQKSIHRDNPNTCEREFTQSSDPVRQSSNSHSGKNSCGLSASIKHRRIAPKTKGVKGRNACVRLSLDPHQGLYLGGKPKNCLKRENCRRWGCSPFEPGRAPRGLQTLKHEQRFPSLPLLAKTAAEPTVAQLMAVLQQLAADTAEIKSSVASLHITISGIQNALGNLSGCTDEAEHRISDLEDTSRNTKAQLVQHCSDIKAIEAKLIGKAVQTNVIAGLWSSLSVKRGTSPLNFPPNS